jgi:CheY-like chemotaxis protein
MKKLSDCRVLPVDDAKPNVDVLVEGLKPDHNLSLELNREAAVQIAARIASDLAPLDIMTPSQSMPSASAHSPFRSCKWSRLVRLQLPR